MNPLNEKLFITPEGLDLIIKYEGYRPTAYLCPNGIPTIGFGHTGQDVTMADVRNKKTITRKQAMTILSQDVAKFQSAVRLKITVPLNPNQFSALVCFAYNVRRWYASSLITLVNEGKYFDAAQAFHLYIYGDPHKPALPGLVSRRAAESELFKKAWKE